MKIATYGFAEDQGRKLGRILQLSKTTPYQLVEFNPAELPDLLLVFGEEQLAENAITNLPKGYHSRLILVGKRRPQTQEYPFIGYPLVSSRVLSALDQLTCANEEFYEEPVEPELEAAQVTAEPIEPEVAAEASDELELDELLPDLEPAMAEAVEAELEAEIDAYLQQEAAASAAEPVTEQTAEPVISATNEVAELSDELEDVSTEALLESEVEIEPVAEIEVPEAVPVQPAAAAEPESVGRQYRVLVVDDSHPMQQALAKELQTQFENLHIDFADEGLVALEMVEQGTYDFIFLDIMMPGIDGFETCTRMRAMEKLKKLPIIMLSSKTSPLDEVKGIMAGSSTYLTKPIDPEEFQKVIARIRKWLDNFS